MVRSTNYSEASKLMKRAESYYYKQQMTTDVMLL